MRQRKNILFYGNSGRRKFQIGGWAPAIPETASNYSDSSLYGSGTGPFSNNARARAGVPNVSTPETKPFGSYGTELKTPNLAVPAMPKSNVSSISPGIIGSASNAGISAPKPAGLVPLQGAKISPVATTLGNSVTAVKAPSAGLSSGAASAISEVGNMAGSFVSTLGDDNNASTNTKKEKAATIGGAALKGASTGLSLGAAIPVPGAAVVGAAVGAVIGTVTGLFKNKKNSKAAKKNARAEYISLTSAAAAKGRAEVENKDTALATGVPSTLSARSDGETPASGYQSMALRRGGGTFHYTLKKNFEREIDASPVAGSIPVFKKGGRIQPTENIIPNGVLHEEENSLGDKGMPVVHCKNNTCSKRYEIERDELIFTLAATRKTEELAKSGNLKELGRFVKAQLLDNTHSFTDKYKELNNRGVENGTIYA